MTVRLFDPERHAPLDEAPLSDDDARAAAVPLAGALKHAAERWLRERPELDLGLYDGAAGGLWLLSKLRGADPSLRRELADALLAEQLAKRARAKSPGSFLVGDVGVFFAAAELGAPDADALLLDALHRAGEEGPNEILYGPPGRALAAAARRAATGDARFADAWHHALDGVLEGRVALEEQHFTADVGRYLGAAHGLAGVLAAVLSSGGLASTEQTERLLDRAERALHIEALHDGERVNWPAEPGGLPLVQWCHGAPGVLLSLATLPAGARPALDESLVGGARLTIDAGAVTKGAGFCHGTSGNALGVLAVARRLRSAAPGEARALDDQARRMLAHALTQLDDEQALHGGDARWALNLYEGPPGVLYGLLALLGEAPLAAPALSGALPWPAQGAASASG